MSRLPNCIRFTLIASFAVALFAPTVDAAWHYNGIKAADLYLGQWDIQAIPDGAGGAIMAFRTESTIGGQNIFAQRIDGDGNPMWGTTGLAIATISTVDQNEQRIVTDGSGGAIIVWQDGRNGDADIYAQRVDAAGTRLWGVNGLPVILRIDNQMRPKVVSDDAGGAIVAWEDDRSGDVDIWVQRINGAGAIQWPTNGNAVCTAANGQWDVAIARDGSGGATMVWADPRFGIDDDLYAQRVNSAGLMQWPINGNIVNNAAFHQQDPVLLGDGLGGTIVAWENEAPGDSDIFVQKMTFNGQRAWATNGVLLCGATGQQFLPSIASDGDGGAIVAWEDGRGGAYDIYARRVNYAGTPQWAFDGVPICTSSDAQRDPEIVTDDSGGAVIVWRDERNPANGADIYVNRVDHLGSVLWGSQGTPVATLSLSQLKPKLVTDGQSGVITMWEDGRSGDSHIFAQRMEGRHGYWGRPEPVIASVTDVPADQGGVVSVAWDASGRDVLGQTQITHYSVWRATDQIPAALASREGSSLLVDPLKIGPDFEGQAYFAAQDYYWEWLANQTAYKLPGYSYNAATTADSIGSNAGRHYFMVMSHTSSQTYAFPSMPDSGHSVDNLAPAPPMMLSAVRVGADVELEWDPSGAGEGDLKEYAVYCSDSPMVTPNPGELLTTTVDTMTTHTGAPGSKIYYIVTAIDVHENESDPSNEDEVPLVTGVRPTPALTTLQVRPNHPNPFSGATELSIGLPQDSDVRLEVFDVVGRRVYAENMPRMSAGWRSVVFQGRDQTGKQLASGVYFYRVTAVGMTQTRKLVISR